MKPPELFAIAELGTPICKETDCGVVENPAHWVSIHLSDTIRETLDEAVKYLTPDSKSSPVAKVLVDRMKLILQTDKEGL